MRRKIINYCSMALVLLLSHVGPSLADDSVFSFRIPNIALGDGERIVLLEIDTTAAAFSTLDHLPLGWDIDVNNDGSYNTKLNGNVTVGAAALDGKSISDIVFHLKKDESRPTEFSVSVTIQTTEDYKNYKSIKVDQAALLLDK